MKAATIKTPRTVMRSWQDISQRAARRPMSPVARRKRLAKALGWLAMAVTAGAVGLFGFWAYRQYRLDPMGLRSAQPGAPLAHVNWQSNGTLTEDWARAYLGLQNGKPLLEFDVFALRRHLLETGQISDAFVERVLPDTVHIRVTERTPLLRLAVDDGTGGYKPYLVARDGNIYEGRLYDDSRLRQLPWVAGLKLHREAGRLLPVTGLDTIESFLTAAQERAPDLTQQWTCVDLGDFDPRPQAPLSLIKVRTRNLGELVFLAQDFHRQLDRLGVVAQNLQEKQLPVKRLDLSFDQQAVVQLAVVTPPPTTRRTSVH
jgi:cell division protein FtsQ